MTNACRKGKAAERELAALLRAAGFGTARRTIQGRGGSEAADLEGLPWRIEVKRGSRRYVRPEDALWQCERDGEAAGDLRVCMAMTRVDREGWVVTLRLADLVEMATGHDTGPAGIVAMPLDAFVRLAHHEAARLRGER